MYRKVVNVGRRVGEGAGGRFQVAAGDLRLCSAMFGYVLTASAWAGSGRPRIPVPRASPVRSGSDSRWPRAPLVPAGPHDFGLETSPGGICSYFAIIQLTAVGAYRPWGSRAFGRHRAAGWSRPGRVGSRHGSDSMPAFHRVFLKSPRGISCTRLQSEIFRPGMCLSGTRISLFPQETPQLALTGGRLWHESREHMDLGVQLVAYSQGPGSCIYNLFTTQGESRCTAGLVLSAFSCFRDACRFVEPRASFSAVKTQFRREILGFRAGFCFCISRNRHLA